MYLLKKFFDYNLIKVKLVENIKTYYQSGNTIVLLDNLKKGKYILYTEDKYGYKYFINFKVEDKLAKSFHTFDDYRESFYFNFHSDYPINKKITKENIKKILGNDLIADFWNNKNLRVYYKPIPGKLYSGNLFFSTILGDIKIPFSLKIDKIPSKYTYVSIEGEKVNILSAKGYWEHHISIGYKNFKSFDLYFQQCNFNPKAKLDKLNYGENIEYAFLKCNGKIIHKVVKVPNFEYRKEAWMDYNLPKEIGNWTLFRVSFYKDFSKGTKYLKKTDLGIFVKQGGNKNYIFVNSFQTGKPVDNVDLLLYSIDGKLQKTLKFKNQQVVFTGNNKPYVIFAQKGNDNTFSTIWKDDRYWENDGNDLKIATNIRGYDIGQNGPWGKDNFIKIFGYTDRGLYKASDTLFFAGWVRNLKEKTKIPQGKVIVKLLSYGKEKQKVEIASLDSFGGFK